MRHNPTTMLRRRGTSGTRATTFFEEHLEFLSIKVKDGPVTAQLQHIQEGGGPANASRRPAGV
jgi:hypothetical protein